MVHLSSIINLFGDNLVHTLVHELYVQITHPSNITAVIDLTTNVSSIKNNIQGLTAFTKKNHEQGHTYSEP